MEATLKFNLPEEGMEHLRAVKATDLALTLWEISKIYMEEYQEESINEALDKYHEKIMDIFKKYNINLEEILE